MKLNRTGSNWNRLERNKINENWDIIEGSYNGVVGKITDEVVGHLIDSAKLIWKEPVDTYGDLPTNAEVGETRMVRESDDGVSHVYRYNGEKWELIQEIDATLVNEVDRRLSAQLAQTENLSFHRTLISHKQRKPMIWWIDDDANIGVYTKLYPLAREYNIPFTSAVITSRLAPDFDGFMTIEQIKELNETGLFEFVSHTHWHRSAHRPIDMSEEELHEDFTLSQNFLKEHGLNYRGLVLPFGDTSELIKNVARQYFDFTVGTGAGGTGTVQIPPIDQYDIRRVSVQYDFERVAAQIDRAAEENGLVVLVSHVDQYNWWSEEYARQIIEYALSKGLEFVTSKDALAAHGNIAQFGDTKITPDGEVFSDEIGKVQYRPRSKGIDHETPISDFPKNVISFTDINTQLAPNFPTRATGMLYTHRYDLDVYGYQVYVTSREYNMFTRTWNDSTKTWGDWFNNSFVQYAGVNGVLSSVSPLLKRLQNKVTFAQINAAGNAGFPENKSGLLVNYSHETFSDYPFQDYHIYQEAKTYRRFWKGGAWTSWELVNGSNVVKEKPGNTVTINTPSTEFDAGVTFTYLTAAGDKSGFPNQESGTLVTYKLAPTTKGMAWQEYKTFNNWDKYIRHEQTDGSWSAWKRFTTEWL